MHRVLIVLLLLPILTSAQIITTIAGNDNRGRGGNNGPATTAELNQPIAITADDSGNVYIVDARNDDIRKISGSGVISIFASTKTSKPHGIVAGDGKIYFTENANNIVRMVTADGTKTTVAGVRGIPGYKFYGDNSATNATLNGPNGIALDKQGNLYFADGQNNRIRRISKDGTITTIAGNGNPGYQGDGGKAIRAQINTPWGVTTDDNGNVYFTDMGNNVVRKIDGAGIISTIAGTGIKGFDGDGRPATNATLNEPRGIAIDKNGCIYIADARNDAVRRISEKGIISTFAGNGRRLFHIGDTGLSNVAYVPDNGRHGDGGPATKAQLYWPHDVTLDRNGDLYIADGSNHVVRKVTIIKSEVSKAEIPRRAIPHAEIPAVTLRRNEALKTETEKADFRKVEIPYLEMPRAEIPKDEIAMLTITKMRNLKTETQATTLLNVGITKVEFPEIRVPDDSIPKLTIAKARVMKAETHPYAAPKVEVQKIQLFAKIVQKEEIQELSSPKPDLFKTEPKKLELPEVEIPKTDISRAEVATLKITGIPLNKLKTFVTDNQGKELTLVTVPEIHLPRPEVPKVDITKFEFRKARLFRQEIARLEMNLVDIPKVEMPKPAIPEAKSTDETFYITADPDKETLTITLDTNAYASFTITDFNGKTLITRKITGSRTSVDISNLPPAHYFINLAKDAGTKTTMFVKDK